jgi:PAS domain S-box-containing protein
MAKHFQHWMDRSDASREQFFGLLQTGLDLLNQGLTVFNEDLELVAWNQTFFTLLEFPQHFARVGMPFSEFLRYNAQRGEYGDGNVEALVSERMGWARAFEPHYAERVRPNGKVMAVRGEPLPGKGFITVYTDITAQRRFEQMLREQNQLLETRVQERTRDLQASAEALRSSENRLRVITDAIPALIAYCDGEHRYRFANLGYARWFGMSKEAIVGRHIREVVGEEVYGAIAPHLNRMIAARQPVSYEYSRVRDGRTEYARSTALPELGAKGEMLGFFVLSQDVTEQRRAQAVLAQAQKMEAVGRLTDGIAHDFNDVLADVVDHLTGLQHDLEDADAQRRIAPALASAQRGMELAQRLLLFSRQRTIEDTSADVGAAVARLLPQLRRALPPAIRLEVEPPSAPTWAKADAVALESALLNIALNASDAMPQGGELRIRVTMAFVADREARELGLDPGQYAKVTVRDTGKGMDESVARRAFEPFFTTKSAGAGNGLGLAMVYGFVTRSHGAVRVDSTPGYGTSVALWLPWIEAPGPDEHA